jgi:hypothetical protein
VEITAWYDESKRAKVLESLSDIYYYMVHATNVEERRNWAMAYTQLLSASTKSQDANS